VCTEASQVRTARSAPCSHWLIEKPGVDRAGWDHVIDSYVVYLTVERGLTAGTVRLYAQIASRCLDEWARLGVDADALDAADVIGFVLAESKRSSTAVMKNVVTGLRSLLRFMFAKGLICRQLAAAVPSVAGWQMTSLPQALDPGQVRGLIASCDRETVVGRRDYAILLSLWRLGMRAGEVAALTLDDMDWRHGELVVRGKSRREERLPLPVDVGEALVASLRDRPSATAYVELFGRVRAPLGSLSTGGIRWVVYSACDRAGVVRVGPHVLRHTTATELLRSGSSLPEVAQVLRHRSVDTTAIYAKVDRVTLMAVAQPWPGATS
jgi:site-specific recombinase XerD